jgi:hypothetical protein
LFEHWMPNFRGDLCQRLKHEAPLMHRWVGYGKLLSLDYGIAKQQNVQVNGARALDAFFGAVAALLPFDLQDSR